MKVSVYRASLVFIAVGAVLLHQTDARINLILRNFNLHEHPVKVLKATGVSDLVAGSANHYHHYHHFRRPQHSPHEGHEIHEDLNEDHIAHGVHTDEDAHGGQNNLHNDNGRGAHETPTDYYDDGSPGLFSPAIDKPFERAQTLTGKYYMPELAYARRHPSRFRQRSHVSFRVKSLRPSPVAVSGTVFPVGLPVVLANSPYLLSM